MVAVRPQGFALPPLADLETAVKRAIDACKGSMAHTTVSFEDELKKAKEGDTNTGDNSASDAANDDEPSDD